MDRSELESIGTSTRSSTPPIFPRIEAREANAKDGHDDNHSIRQLRSALFRPAEFQESVDISNTGTASNHFKTQFDTDSEDNSSVHAYSIQTTIVKGLDISDRGAHTEDTKFKFLDAYERNRKRQRNLTAKSYENVDSSKDGIPLQVLDADDESVFNLSQLDDFTKFVRSTELNNAIHKKYTEVTHNDNVLDVIPTTGLEDYVGNFDDDHTRVQKASKSTKSPWFALDWKKPPPLQNTDIQEISFNSTFSAESDSPPETKYLQRKLKVRHLQMISFGGTLGVGLFLNSGKALTIAGGFGTLLAFVICGIIVLTTIISFCEMVTFVSVVDGVSGLSSRFVDDSFGFAVGWLYFFSFAFGLTGEIVASVIMLSYFPELKILDNKASMAGFVTLFLFCILFVNLIDVRIFGEVEYISSLIKLLITLVMIIVMIIMNTGHLGSKEIGFKYWQHEKSDFEHNLIFGLFRPTFNLQDNGTDLKGIGGDKGRFLSLLVAILVVSYAYSGTEIVCIAACEAQNPRKALPSATRRVFWRILIFYCLSAFVVSLNVYAGDPRLLRYYSGSTGVSGDQFSSNYAINYVGGAHCYDQSTIFAGFGSGSQSPWIVALQSVKKCNFSSVFNGFLVFFAVSCGNAQLYVSSRTIYSLALQKKAPKIFSYCNNQGIPYNAVLFSGSFGILSYICVSEQATNVFQNLTSIISSSGIFVWFAMCLSYIRFYYGLKKRPDIISRDDKSYPYKSRFQPYSAFIGLVGSATILLCMGFVVFLKDEWDTLFFFSSYGALMVFAVLYLGHKYIKSTRIPSLETLDFDSGRREMDRYIWDGGREYNLRSIKDVAQKWISFLA
ncbi:SPS-sensor component Ssy1p [[Candida] anglica]|uniref:SPS-sensor component Ssy1p n=1 Tax=[Candida] anglica TaxID=148631 RepID=A0ABP0EAR0_9ASCO